MHHIERSHPGTAKFKHRWNGLHHGGKSLRRNWQQRPKQPGMCHLFNYQWDDANQSEEVVCENGYERPLPETDLPSPCSRFHGHFIEQFYEDDFDGWFLSFENAELHSCPPRSPLLPELVSPASRYLPGVICQVPEVCEKLLPQQKCKQSVEALVASKKHTVDPDLNVLQKKTEGSAPLIVFAGNGQQLARPLSNIFQADFQVVADSGRVQQQPGAFTCQPQPLRPRSSFRRNLRCRKASCGRGHRAMQPYQPPLPQNTCNSFAFTGFAVHRQRPASPPCNIPQTESWDDEANDSTNTFTGHLPLLESNFENGCNGMVPPPTQPQLPVNFLRQPAWDCVRPPRFVDEAEGVLDGTECPRNSTGRLWPKSPENSLSNDSWDHETGVNNDETRNASGILNGPPRSAALRNSRGTPPLEHLAEKGNPDLQAVSVTNSHEMPATAMDGTDYRDDEDLVYLHPPPDHPSDFLVDYGPGALPLPEGDSPANKPDPTRRRIYNGPLPVGLLPALSPHNFTWSPVQGWRRRRVHRPLRSTIKRSHLVQLHHESPSFGVLRYESPDDSNHQDYCCPVGFGPYCRACGTSRTSRMPTDSPGLLENPSFAPYTRVPGLWDSQGLEHWCMDDNGGPVRCLNLHSERAESCRSVDTSVRMLSRRHRSHGQLGHGYLDPEDGPRIIECLEGIRICVIAAGGWHSAAVSSHGDLYTWGWNESGQLGFPTKKVPQVEAREKDEEAAIVIQALPQCVSFPKEVSVVFTACGSRHTLVLTDQGTLWSFGWNSYGQLGKKCPNFDSRPSEVEYFWTNCLRVTGIFAGGWSSLVRAVPLSSSSSQAVS